MLERLFLTFHRPHLRKIFQAEKLGFSSWVYSRSKKFQDPSDYIISNAQRSDARQLCDDAPTAVRYKRALNYVYSPEEF